MGKIYRGCEIMTEEDDVARYADTYCPFGHGNVRNTYSNGMEQTQCYCWTKHCAAWQICDGTVGQPKYGCRFIERGFEF